MIDLKTITGQQIADLDTWEQREELGRRIRELAKGQSMTSIEQRRLEPCPFCGSDEAGVHPDEHHIMLCDNCEAQGPRISFGGPKDAAERWNTRAALTAMNDQARSPIGKDAKLNELIFLSMVAALNELGKGYDQPTLKKHADHAAKLWSQHTALSKGDAINAAG